MARRTGKATILVSGFLVMFAMPTSLKASTIFTTVDFGSQANFNSNSFYGFPAGGVSYNAVPFDTSLQTNGNNAWLAGSGPYNAWNTSIGNQTLTLSVNILNATDVYALVNTWWGYNGYNNGSATFYATSNVSYSVNLMPGYNVRDIHVNPNTSLNVTAPYVTPNVVSDLGVYPANPDPNNPAPDRQDMLDIVLPNTFQGQTLTAIVFDNAGTTTGALFVNGVTTASVTDVPEPSTLGALTVGLLGLGLARRCKTAITVALSHDPVRNPAKRSAQLNGRHFRARIPREEGRFSGSVICSWYQHFPRFQSFP